MIHQAVLNDPEASGLSKTDSFSEHPLAMPLNRPLGSLTGANDWCDMHIPAARELSGIASDPSLLGVYKAFEFIP